MSELKKWTLAAIVLAASVAVVALVRALIRIAGKNKRWTFLPDLAPALSNLTYIIGLQVAAEFMPVTPIVKEWIDKFIYVLAALLLVSVVRKAALLTLEWTASRGGPSQTLQQGFVPLFRNVITLFVFLAAGIMILKRFNYDVMSLVAALGVSSLAVGLAAKETLSNMISGFTLIIDRNLTPGDRINLAGSIGEVEEIGLRSTRIKTGDGNILIVPNSELANTRILNLSIPSALVTASSTFRVAYEVEFERVRSLCLRCIEEIPHARKDRGTWVNLVSLADGGQTITVGFWVSSLDEQSAAQSELNQKLVTRLRSEKIPLVSPAAPFAAPHHS